MCELQPGGAINNCGALHIASSSFADGSTELPDGSTYGGVAIFNSRTLSITNSHFDQDPSLPDQSAQIVNMPQADTAHDGHATTSISNSIIDIRNWKIFASSLPGSAAFGNHLQLHCEMLDVCQALHRGCIGESNVTWASPWCIMRA